MPKNKIINMLSILFLCLIPTITWAGTQTPWEIIVMGNGAVIAKLLIAVAGIMNSSGFLLLMNTIAIIGLILLVVQMGFDPSKGAMKLISFILTVWFVVLSGTKITVPVTIIDKVNAMDSGSHTGTNNANNVNLLGNTFAGQSMSLTITGTNFFGTGETNTSTIPNMPIVIALPAYLMSYVGDFLTQTLQAHLDMDPSLSLASGKYNLAAKLLEDAQKVKFVGERGAAVRKNLVQYTADCFMNAAAMKEKSYASLRSSSDIWATMKTSGGFVTRVVPAFNATEYPKFVQEFNTWNTTRPLSPAEQVQAAGIQSILNNITTSNIYQAFLNQKPGATGIMSCGDAYDLISLDLAMIAPSMILGSSFDNWKASNSITAPLADQLTSTMNWIGMMGDPSNHIKQMGMINILDGTYKEASQLGGGNEASLSLAIATATEAQKSSWVVGTQVFNNMMGYVYAALQAFVFGIIPVMLVALMIPGFGMKIFVNFGQILIWLALWEPMYAIINYLIYAYGQADIGGAVSGVGFTYDTQSIISEKTANLEIAAAFLGTMVPMISWGIVKGAMAFTEFIAHGVGGQFAGVAGQQAATGNISLNNASMDNASMNKSNYANQSTIGNQEMLIGNGSFAAMQQNYHGGSGESINGSNLSKQFTTGKTLNDQGSMGRSTGAIAAGGYDMTGGNQLSGGKEASLSNGGSNGDKYSDGAHKGDSIAAQQSGGLGNGAGQNNTTGNKANLNGQVGLNLPSGNGGGGTGPGGTGTGGGAPAGFTGNGQQAALLSAPPPSRLRQALSRAGSAIKPTANASLAHEEGGSATEQRNAARNEQATRGTDAGTKESVSKDKSFDRKSSVGDKGSKTKNGSDTHKYGNTHSDGTNAGTSKGWGANSGISMGMQLEADGDDLRMMVAQASAFEGRYGAMQGQVDNQMDQHAAALANDKKQADAAYNAAGAAFDASLKRAQAENDATQKSVDEKDNKIRGAADNNLSQMAAPASAGDIWNRSGSYIDNIHNDRFSGTVPGALVFENLGK